MKHRTKLVESLLATGAIRTRPVREAFENLPRERFVPRFQKRGTDEVIWIDSSNVDQRDEWISGVYDDVPLVTQSTSAPDIVSRGGFPTSSSSMPTVMAEMLEALSVQPGNHVLEIGTGTGYNAALLCHLVGDSNVVSIELHPELARTAREALASVGFHPTIVCADGATGIPSVRAFDRVIATASVDHIPPAWIDATAPGALIVADLRGSLDGGLIRLTASGDGTASGRFLDIPGAFMPMRTRLDSPHRDCEDWTVSLNKINPHQGSTAVDPHVVASDRSLRFIIQMHLAGHRVRGLVLGDATSELSGYTTDGAWFSVGPTPGRDGRYPILQGGSQRLWDTIECAHTTWQRLDRPDISRYGVTAPDHAALQHVWIGNPDSATRWPLPL